MRLESPEATRCVEGFNEAHASLVGIGLDGLDASAAAPMAWAQEHYATTLHSR